MTQGEVEIERDGRRITARYRIERGMLTVTWGSRSRSAKLDPSLPVEVLAELLLSELVREDDGTAQ